MNKTLLWTVGILVCIGIIFGFYYMIQKLTPSAQKILKDIEEVTPKIKKFVDTIEKNEDRIEKIINDLDESVPELKEDLLEIKQAKPEIRKSLSNISQLAADYNSANNIQLPLYFKYGIPSIIRLNKKVNKLVDNANKSARLVTSAVTGLYNTKAGRFVLGESKEEHEKEQKEEEERQLKLAEEEEKEDAELGEQLYNAYLKEKERVEAMRHSESFRYPLDKPLPLPSGVNLFSIK